MSARISGTRDGLFLTNIDLFAQGVRYVLDKRYCQKEGLSDPYSDPLALISYCSYMGSAYVNGKYVDWWGLRYPGTYIDLFSTPSAVPVQLVFVQSGYGIKYDYHSFASGSTAQDFAPPSYCSSQDRSEDLRRASSNYHDLLLPIRKFLAEARTRTPSSINDNN